MKQHNVYINGVGSISIQEEGALALPDWGEENYLRCIDPPFAQYISPALLRRMSKVVKRGIVSALLALKDGGIEMPDAIISGTGLGCIEDTEKFLSAMIEQNEQFLQPTHFIQSTHNTVSSQIAIMLKCYNYNNTFSHLGISLESALFDGFLQIKMGMLSNALINGCDEMTPDYHLMLKKVGFWKDTPFQMEDMYQATTSGTVAGEGCNSLLLSNEKNEHTYAEIKDIQLIHLRNNNNIEELLEDFLDKNGLTLSEIDAVMSGINGDMKNDAVYDKLYTEGENNPTQLIYRHLSGDFFTSSGFGLIQSAKVLKNQNIEPLLFRKENKKNKIRHILFHNHYKNSTHALILLSVCSN